MPSDVKDPFRQRTKAMSSPMVMASTAKTYQNCATVVLSQASRCPAGTCRTIGYKLTKNPATTAEAKYMATVTMTAENGVHGNFGLLVGAAGSVVGVICQPIARLKEPFHIYDRYQEEEQHQDHEADSVDEFLSLLGQRPPESMRNQR